MKFEFYQSRKDYVKASVIMLYRKPLFYLVSLGMLGLVILYTSRVFLGTGPYSDIFLPAIMLISLPVLTIASARKNFRTNPRLKEKLSYDFSESTLTVSGQTFNATLALETLHKVVLIRKWLFIFQTPQVANPIPPQHFTQEDLKALKTLLTAKGIRNNLK